MKTFSEFLSESRGNLSVIPLKIFKKMREINSYVTGTSKITKIDYQIAKNVLSKGDISRQMIVTFDADRYKIFYSDSGKLLVLNERSNIPDVVKSFSVYDEVYLVDIDFRKEFNKVFKRDNNNTYFLKFNPLSNITVKYFRMLLNDLNRIILKAETDEIMDKLRDNRTVTTTANIDLDSNNVSGSIWYHLKSDFSSDLYGPVSRILRSHDDNKVDIHLVERVVKHYKNLYRVIGIK